ncbi:MAG: GNAT family N-acetyltransferase [Erysipelothrix sp.]|nr:GNAT family N-acetyltransferase [Erysipelothrix sp.]
MRLRKVRQLESYEYDILPLFLYNSIFQSDDEEMLEYSVIKDQSYAKYINDFGKDTDFAVAWELDGRIAGIAWVRLFDEADESFGYVDEITPELTLSVLAGYDDQLIGPELISIVFNELRLQGAQKVSVSLDINDCYTSMYEKLGFEQLRVNADNTRVLFIKNLV